MERSCAFTTPEGTSFSLKLTDKNTCYISDSGWSLRARCPPKEPGRTYRGKASSNTISFFVVPLIIGLIFLHDPANALTAIVHVETAVIGLKELHICLPTCFLLAFLPFLCFFFLFHMKLSLEKEGKQSKVR